MFGWFMQRGEPEDADLRRMVRMILTVSSRIEPFECRWRVSPILLAASLALWALALLSILLAALPVWLKPPLALVCLAYGAWGCTARYRCAARGPSAACAMTSGLAAVERRKRLASGAIAP